MKAIFIRKLRSDRGASLTFALLILLVCAVVGSVVLTAATAAAGRLSRLRESDRRYYSVTSAAELMREQLDGASVTITRSRTTAVTHTSTYQKNEAGAFVLTGTETVSGTPVCACDAVRRASLLQDGLIDLLFGPLAADFSTEDAWAASLPGSAAVTRRLTLSHTAAEGIAAAPLQIAVTAVFSPDGTLTLTLASDDGSTDVYTLSMVFTADAKERTGVSTVTGSPTVAEGEEGYTETRTDTRIEQRITEVTWRLSSLKKAVKG